MHAERRGLLGSVSVVLDEVGSELHASLVSAIDMDDPGLTVCSSCVLEKAPLREGIFNIEKTFCTSSLIFDRSPNLDWVDEKLLSWAYQSTTSFSDWVGSIAICVAISDHTFDFGSREEI